MSIPEGVLKEIKERVACLFDLSRFSSDEKYRFLDLFDSYYPDEVGIVRSI